MGLEDLKKQAEEGFEKAKETIGEENVEKIVEVAKDKAARSLSVSARHCVPFPIGRFPRTCNVFSPLPCSIVSCFETTPACPSERRYSQQVRPADQAGSPTSLGGPMRRSVRSLAAVAAVAALGLAACSSGTNSSSSADAEQTYGPGALPTVTEGKLTVATSDPAYSTRPRAKATSRPSSTPWPRNSATARTTSSGCAPPSNRRSLPVRRTGI